ncbi:hypothetical protein K2173_019711 [Erythroxylum novogranatense]|uniref:Transposase n=1 Tax=Erythroxylum novogranatense TaxID=1862640 RepID=A0AAV8SM55_9ROSI|nr:hypothetical protein K2173_019711 [Erythroxylum novogranatense]
MHLQELLFKKPEPIPTNSLDHRWRWFKNCLGALDGTYIRVNVPIKDKARFRTRKGDITINMLGVDGDGRVLRDAITRRHGLKVPHGYTNCEGFLAPFRGQRYHLNEWRQGYQPRTAEEFFNMKHASARNVIERCFGLLKIRQEMSFDPMESDLGDDFYINPIVEEEPITAIDPTNAWTNWRIGLAREMFNEWQTSRQIEN